MAQTDENGTESSFAELRLSERPGAVRFGVKVRPRSSRSGIVAVREGVLEIALAAPPVDGAANDALIRLLAKILGVRKGDLLIALGSHHRDKVVEVSGIDAASLRAKLREATR